MLQNAPGLAIVAVDTEENERLKFGVNYSVYSVTSLVPSNGDGTPDRCRGRVDWKFFHFLQTSRGSFSAVSTATIARVGSFFSIFWGLQDLQSFAPLRSQNFRKKSSDFFAKMKFHFHFHFHSCKTSMNFVIFLLNVDEILKKEKKIFFEGISRRVAEKCKMSRYVHKLPERLRKC